MTQAWLFTSESVAAGHPDKLCDAISDAIVDACLALDPKAKVAVETLVKGREDRSHIVLAGEVKLAAGVEAPDYIAIARKTAAAIGYTSHGIGMDATSEDLCEVTELITSQSAHINRGVVQSVDDQGAGDQGLMFGYACNETEAYPEHQGRWMPLAIALSQALTRQVSKLGLDGTLPWARPDAKSQVTLMHVAMYLCLVLLPVTGLAIAWLFNQGMAEEAFAMEMAIGLHGFSADLSYALIAIHVVAALYSRIKGEGVWTSMVPVFTESGPSTNEYVVKAAALEHQALEKVEAFIASRRD